MTRSSGSDYIANPPHIRVGIIVLFALTSGVCSAQMYKCVDANGTATFSDKPCGPNAQVHIVQQQAKSAAFSGSVSTLETGATYHSPDASVGQSPYPMGQTFAHRGVRTVVVDKQVVVIDKQKTVVAEKKSQHHAK